jgi:hypothetical protein
VNPPWARHPENDGEGNGPAGRFVLDRRNMASSTAPVAAETFLGFRPHTGWACMVALTGQVHTPEVVDRRRLQFTSQHAARFIYHAAADLPAAVAEASVRRASTTARKIVGSELKCVLESLLRSGLHVRKAALANPRTAPGTLERVLASHTLIHSAEGWLWRSAVADACRSAGMSLITYDEKTLMRRAAGALNVDESELASRVAAMRKAAGPPWAEDQRICAVAAWLAMTEQ